MIPASESEVMPGRSQLAHREMHESKQMRVLFLTKYSSRGPSSRYRALQYFPFLRAQGWSVSWQPFLSDAYLERFYADGRRSVFEGCRAFLRRMKYCWFGDLDGFDVIYIEDEALPRIPFVLEALLFGQKHRAVLDYDDAVFVPYEGNVFMRDKIARLVGAATEVIVGNEFLRSYAARYTSRVNVIPTVIDLEKYAPKDDYERSNAGHVVIGWVGTPATVKHLRSFAGVLRRLSNSHPILLRCVGTPAGFSMPGVAVENLEWREETEAQIIRTFDLGIMPLINEPFARGKCGLKLIQYMGCAVPSIGQDVGANREIITDGVNGFVASSDEEYIAKIERLIGSRGLREELGRSGRKTVEDRYSLQVNAHRFSAVLRKAAAGQGLLRCAASRAL